MAQETSKNIRVGLFVLIGTILLIFSFYLIGSKQNLFGSNFRLSAQFHNVNGLMPGNNVRFTGIDVGTVESVEIINDTTVNVVMIIEDKVQEFIKKNATAIVGTDGLMGNKLININSSKEDAPSVEDGDVLLAHKPVGTDEMMKTLNITNENVREITVEIKNIVKKLNSPNTLWSILMDTVVAENVKQAIVNIKVTGERTAIITGDLSRIVQHVKEGKGTIGALLTDTAFSTQLHQSIVNIKLISDSLALVSGDLHYITSHVKSGKGAIGTVLMDTNFVNNLNKSMINIESGTKNFDQDMEALKHNILLRNYFKKQEKKKAKEQK
ncbi:MAG: MCE family protein [Bacteroidetes bacterium]|jgi:phospholipid/cholesterol/gamma-HCH transport system substrate-binding protein|nr:MCE family protein [Bacteroidota bacterium]